MGLRHRHSFEAAVDRLKADERSGLRLPVAGRVNVAVVFPRGYALGMSNLGFLTVHRLAGTTPGIGVERFFFPLVEGRPFPPPWYSFETRRPLGDFDVLAFSLSFEGDFDRIPPILRTLGIPLDSGKRRKGRYPVLVSGGAGVAANPPAISRIFDIVVPGEGETTVPTILERFVNGTRGLADVAGLPGVWVPALRAEANPAPSPHPVAESPAWSHITTPHGIFGGATLLEIMRGCPRSCAFCLARKIYFPPRAFPAEGFTRWLSGHPDVKEIGLVAPSLFDHPGIGEILETAAERKIRVRNSSVKWEKLSERILSLLFECGVRGLTIAPETGSGHLRDGMGKPLQEEALFAMIETVRRLGFEQLKLYFMTGLPGEADADLDATAELIRRIAGLFPGDGRKMTVSRRLTVNVSGFVPKRGTPWGDAPFAGERALKKAFSSLRGKLAGERERVDLRFDSPQAIARQAHLSRVGPELVEEYEKEEDPCRLSAVPAGTDPETDF